MFDLAIINGRIADALQDFCGCVYVKNGKIAAVTAEPVFEAAETIDASGLIVLPGFIDPHAHLNDPGLTESEDFYTGTCSAAAGGITTVIEHPMTFPSPSTGKILADKDAIAKEKAVVDYTLFGACNPDNADELIKMKEAGAAGVKAFMPYSPEIPKMNDGQLLFHMKKLREIGLPLIVHCENDDIVSSCTEKMISEGRTAPADYPDGRPEIAETEAVERLAKLAQETGASAHVAHCSTAESLRIVQAYREKGVNITVETCPHYLLFNRDLLEEFGPYGICNPPLRRKENVEDMWSELKKGHIHFVGSDHCAYTYEEKAEGEGNAFSTPPGMTSIQTCFPMLFDEAVGKRGLDLNAFVRLTSTNAAKKYGMYPKKGTLQPGADADLVILDPDREWMVSEDRLFYKQPWTPVMGWKVKTTVERTIVRGKTVYHSGTIEAEPGYGRYALDDEDGKKEGTKEE